MVKNVSKTAVAVGLACVVYAGFGSNANAETMRLRVLTFNIWGLPIITPEREARVAAMGPAIEALKPDLVALQEVWLDEDANALAAALDKAGLGYSWRSESMWVGHNGLLIASRYPIRDIDFDAYTQGSHPNTPWHLDWVAGKGLGRVRVETPVGEIDFAATHMQARYGSEDYLFVQLSQVLEAADVLATRSARWPLIVAGDLNSPWHALPYQMLANRVGLAAAKRHLDIDTILFRSGEDIVVQPRESHHVLTEQRDINGTQMALSDHPGVLAELELSRCDGCGRPQITGALRFDRLAAEARALVTYELDITESTMIRDRLLASSLVLLTFSLFLLRRRSTRMKRLPLARLVFLSLIIASCWFAYLGISYGPTRLADLQEIQARLNG